MTNDTFHTPPEADGTEPDNQPTTASGEMRTHARLEFLEETIVQLMAIKRYCARGDADIEALDAAIRWGLKRHRNATAWLVRKRNGPTIGDLPQTEP